MLRGSVHTEEMKWKRDKTPTTHMLIEKLDKYFQGQQKW